MSFLRQYLFAVRAFTRVPVTASLARWAGPHLPESSAAHFPGVGWLAGVLACASFALVGLALPDSAFTAVAAATASIAAGLLLTGAAHESALARAADAMAGPPTGEAIGAPGVLALVLAVLAKVSLLAVIAAQSSAAVMAALLAAQVVSRFWPLLPQRAAAPAGEPAVAQPPASRLAARALGIAAAWSVPAPLVAWLAGGPGFALGALALSAAAAWGTRGLWQRRPRGLDEETLGAAQQLCEIGFYMGAAIGLRLG